MFETWARFVVAAPRRVILAVLVLVAALAVSAASVRYVADVDRQMPASSPLRAGIMQVQERFNARDTLAFMVRSEDPGAQLRATCALSQFLESSPIIAANTVLGPGSNTIKYVENRGGNLVVTGLAAVCESPIGLDARVIEGLGPQRQFLVADDGSLLVYADLDVPAGTERQAIETIDAWLAANRFDGVSIQYAGQPRFLAVGDAFSQRIALFMPIIILIIAALHWEALRSLQAVIIPLITGAFATLAGLGLYGLLGRTLDTVSALAPVLILAVGAGHSVQLLKRYMEEVRERTGEGRADLQQNQDALVATVKALGPVLSLAVLGAASCLFALLVLDVPALGDFGLLAGSGIIAALLLELTLIPAIRALLPPPVVKAGFGELSPWWRTRLSRVERAAMTWPKARIGAGLAALVALLALGLPRIEVDSAFGNYLGDRLPAERDLAAIVASDIGPFSLDVVIDTGRPGGAFAPEALAQAQELEAILGRDHSVRATDSAAAVMGFLKCRFTAAEDCSAVAIGSAEEAAQIWTFLLGGDGGRLIDAEARFLRVRAFADNERSDTGRQLLTLVEAWRGERGASVTIGGSAVTAYAIETGMVEAAIEKGFLLLAIVAVIGGLAFRSLTLGAIFAAASGLTLLMNYSFLGWSGITLNSATAVSASVAVGVGVDYLLYISFRLREGLRRGLPLEAAMSAAHASAGGAAVCVALAVGAAFAVLVFSFDFHIHQWIAALLPITMLMSLFGALFVFPALVRIMRPRAFASRPSKDHLPIRQGSEENRSGD